MAFFQQIRSTATRKTLPQLFQTSSFKHVVLSSSIRSAHTIRVILTKDLPEQNQYAGETLTVKAGYARNYLIPQKLALYATPTNFVRVGIEDPELSKDALEKKKKEAAADVDEDAKAADFLRYYLRNKTLKIWRNVDIVNIAGGTGEGLTMSMENAPIYPGVVTHENVRQKLGKQLKIDLEDHEKIQIMPKPVNFSLMDEDENLMDTLLNSMEPLKKKEGSDDELQDCNVKLKALGEYLVKIHLRGGYAVGLRLNVVRR